MLDSVTKLLKIKAAGGHMTPEILSFLDDPDHEVRRETLVYVKDIPDEKLKRLIHDDNKEVAMHAIHHPNVWESHLKHALESADPTIHAAVAGHEKLTYPLIEKILDSQGDFEVKRLAVKNKHNSSSVLGKIMRKCRGGDLDCNRLVLEAVAHPKALDTDIADVILNTKDVNSRMVAAHNLKSHSAILNLLNDESVPESVKRVLLLNKRFDKNDWWKIKDRHLRNRLKEENVSE